ncbi:MAG TPA: histidine phosphatase family protein [Thermoanaerobaculia bacterium]|nr:histidine phosphatase family protein [Thermoanaerobaculia bacterium]
MNDRELYILRHGKSDWETTERDHDRPLKTRGVEAARTIGRLLQAAGCEPDRVITSSAVRSRTTAELAAQAGGFGCGVAIDPRLYDASLDTWLGVVRATDDGVVRLLVAGHEPTCSEAIEHLTGAAVEFPTAALARLDIESSWQRLNPRSTRLAWLVTPKLIQAMAGAP